MKSAVLDSEGNVFKGSAFSVSSSSESNKEEILSTFKKIILKGLEYIRNNDMKPGGIGLSFPGPFDFKNAFSLMKHKFKAIYGIDLRNFFYKIPGITNTLPVIFMNDANAVLEGEIWKGKAKGFDNAAVVTLGTGLGFTYSKNGIVQCNELGSPQISIFKFPYKDGILEDYTAKRGFLKIYSELSGRNDINDIKVVDIAQWADKGDINSIRVFREVSKILSESLKSILVEKKIQCLLFSGQISKAFHHMETTLKEELTEVQSLKKISVVKSIDNAALLGTLRNIHAESLLYKNKTLSI